MASLYELMRQHFGQLGSNMGRLGNMFRQNTIEPMIGGAFGGAAAGAGPSPEVLPMPQRMDDMGMPGSPVTQGQVSQAIDQIHGGGGGWPQHGVPQWARDMVNQPRPMVGLDAMAEAMGGGNAPQGPDISMLGGGGLGAAMPRPGGITAQDMQDWHGGGPPGGGGVNPMAGMGEPPALSLTPLDHMNGVQSRLQEADDQKDKTERDARRAALTIDVPGSNTGVPNFRRPGTNHLRELLDQLRQR